MNFWWRNEPPLWSWPLWPLSLAWRAGAAFGRTRGEAFAAKVPVISVGNLVVGGAGKTPVTMALAARLAAAGRKPAVLSRGYAGGDEARLMERRGLTVFVGPSRVASAQRAVEQGADVLLLDDGLQHHALGRDLDVIVADASNPLGNGRVMPMGPLRELPADLSRVRRGLLWLTHCELPRHPRLGELSRFPAVESRYRTRADLRGKRVFAFAGIARPEHFQKTLLDAGAEIAFAKWFGDHHRYTRRELDELRRAAGSAPLVTTEKDLARIDDPRGIEAVPIEVEILRGEEALAQALREIL